MHDLQGRLDAWVAAGLLTPDQARRIAAHETARASATSASGATGVATSAGATAVSPPPPSGARRSVAAEAVGYVGAALALGAIGLFLGELWEDLRVGGRLTLVGLLTVLLFAAAHVLRTNTAPAIRRLTGVLAFGGLVGLAWFTGILAAEVAGWDPPAVGLAIGLAVVAVALVLQVRAPLGPVQVALLLGVVTVVVAALSFPALTPDPFWFGLAVWSVGAAWVLLGFGGWLEPRRLAEVVGGLAALLAAQASSFGDLRVVALLLGLATAGTLVALAVTTDGFHRLVLGAIGLFVLLPQLVFEWFGDAIGAPATLLVVGLLLVLVAVGLGRARRELQTDQAATDGAAAANGGAR